ncbi:uncharacterized protein LOC144630471 [Oculina patagonica]
MRRQAEDMLLSNSNDQKGADALRFILSLANERDDVGKLKRAVRRKLGFLGKAGYDIFGKNKLFAPRIKWEALSSTVEDIKEAAQSYEEAFNDIMSTVQNSQDFQQMASTMSAVSKLQVKAEKDRLVEGRLIAESEKRLYVKSIKQLESQMNSALQLAESMLPDVYNNAKFNSGSLMAMLQAISGFIGSGVGKDPFAFIDAALGLAESESERCLDSLEGMLGSIKKWLSFGENYKPLIDSSDLDFDQLDVDSVPEIMQNNLEMNKEKLATELECMLDDASKPSESGEFQQVIESFFTAGAARIDLIGKIMDLDNDIGGYNFDIPLLEETQQAIADIGTPTDAPISQSLQQTFMENLLSTYRELERSFMRNVYELHKAFEFRTLWEGNNPLTSFQRVASESARGTGRLNGVVQLAGVLQDTKRLQDKAVKCFTNNIYTTDIQKWSFDNVKDKEMFQELAQGYTRFSLNIDDSCATCYNMRLLKIYIELLGSKQAKKVPATVHLQVRHLSGSYFRAGDNTIKQYRQPVGSYRKIMFDRFSISDDKKCKKQKRKGKNNKCSFSCVTKDDSRWQPMCTNQLSGSGNSNQDRLLGMEECKSPFGIYELKIPVDKNLTCKDTGIKNTNCKDLDLTKFTKMNVWTQFFYWSDQYPTGSDDRICRSPRNKRNATAAIVQEFSDDENPH